MLSIFSAALAAALLVLAGCPQPEGGGSTNETKFAVSGTISLDYPQGPAAGAVVQVLKNGAAVTGKSAATGADGKYAIADLAPDTYSLSITLADYQLTAASQFTVSSRNITGKDFTLEKTHHPVSGTVTITGAGDVTQVTVRVMTTAAPPSIISLPTDPDTYATPASDGTFTIAKAPANKTADCYKLIASLAGTSTVAYSSAFDLAAPKIGLTINLDTRPPLPTLSTVQALEAGKITLTFSADVAISAATGLTLEKSGGGAPTVSSVAQGTDAKEWVLTLSRSIASGEAVTLKYDGTSGSVKEAGANGRELAAFSKAVENTFDTSSPVKITGVWGLWGQGAPVLVKFDKTVSMTPANYTGWTLTGSVSGTFAWDGNSSYVPVWNAGYLVLYPDSSHSPTSGETVTLTYNKTTASGNKIVAQDGTELADCNTTVTINPPSP